MRVPTKTIAALLVAGAIPLYAGSAAAAPISGSHALKNSGVTNVEQVQHRRRAWRGQRWIGPAAGIAAGVAIGSALAAPYDDGYYAYGAAPGYEEPDYRGGWRASPQYGRCTGDRYNDSGFPNWECDH